MYAGLPSCWPVSPAVGVGLVLVVALEVLERARLRPGGVRDSRGRQQCEKGQFARKSRRTKCRMPPWR